jgi:hypothetical protein
MNLYLYHANSAALNAHSVLHAFMQRLPVLSPRPDVHGSCRAYVGIVVRHVSAGYMQVESADHPMVAFVHCSQCAKVGHSVRLRFVCSRVGHPERIWSFPWWAVPTCNCPATWKYCTWDQDECVLIAGPPVTFDVGGEYVASVPVLLCPSMAGQSLAHERLCTGCYFFAL